MTAKNKSGAGKFFLGAALGALVGAVASRFMKPNDEDEDFDDEGFDFGDEDTTIYEVECACGNIIDFDEETLEQGSIVCPECGETLEFTTEDEE